MICCIASLCEKRAISPVQLVAIIISHQSDQLRPAGYT